MTRMALALMFAMVITPTAAEEKTKKLSCSDFKTYAEALAVFEKNKASGKGPWKRFDRDNDGRPCECLPGSPEIDKEACKGKARK